MKFVHSHALPRDSYTTGGIAGDIPVRRSNVANEEDVGAERARQDWRMVIGPIPGFCGGWARPFGLMQVAVPECLPDRLSIISYACELGFLYDDFAEPVLDQISHNSSSNLILDGVAKLQKQLFVEMLIMDEPRAQVAIQYWLHFQSQLSSRNRVVAMRSFDEYLDYRITDVGEMLWLGLVTFGMALDLPKIEIDEIRTITKPEVLAPRNETLLIACRCWVVLALQNDFCSYQKEQDEHQGSTEPCFLNAISVLMYNSELSEATARNQVLNLLQANVELYQKQVESAMKSPTLSADSLTYIEALLYTISGDAAWSLVAPRYNRRPEVVKSQL